MGQSDKSSSTNTFPWKEILAFLGTVLVAYFGYLGARSQIEIPIHATQTAEAKLTSVAQKTPESTSAVQPPSISITATLIPQSLNNLNGMPIARLPTLQEINDETIPSIWEENNINVRDMTKPGIFNYSGIVRKDIDYLFNVKWCAMSSQILTENLQALRAEFFINEVQVSNQNVTNYVHNRLDWECSYYAIVIGGWNAPQYVLEFRRIFSKKYTTVNLIMHPGHMFTSL